MISLDFLVIRGFVVTSICSNYGDDFLWKDSHGRLHRLGGPAYESHIGVNMWFITGFRYYNFKEFQEAGNLTDEQMCILRLKYGDMNG